MRRCLLNLVQDALEYGRPPIVVHTALEGGEIELSVQDGGEGLDENQWQRAIRAFHRLRDQPSQGHSGLELAPVQRLATTSGGSASAKRGTAGFSVTVKLPAQSA